LISDVLRLLLKIYIICSTQLASIMIVLRDVTRYDSGSVIYFGDPGPWALGVDHAFGVC
jgi:hypothetical protein